jgi:hypothetical protein
MSRKTNTENFNTSGKVSSPKKGKIQSMEPSFILDSLRWLARCEQKFVSGEQWITLGKLANTLENLIQTRGKEEGIRIAKTMRLFIFRILADEFKGIGLIENLASTDIPRTYKQLLVELQDNHTDLDYIRLILTIFYSTRSLNIKPKVQLSTIEEAYKGTKDLSSDTFVAYINRKARAFWRLVLGRERWEVKPFNALYFKQYHLTTKAGPNGHALWRSIDDFKVLPDSLKESLGILGGPKIKTAFKVLSSCLDKVQPIFDQIESDFLSKRNAQIEKLKESKRMNKRKLKHLIRSLRVPNLLETKYVRKITGLPDQEGKTRTVAIFDYFSQTVLRPLHNYLFSILKGIPQDCTFNQGSFAEKLRTHGFSASTDLSAFTDRFPIVFNHALLRVRFGVQYANAWKDIMIGYPFSLRNVRDDIYYSVGNPMGAYSSWNSTALAHHFLIYLACDELGIDFKSSTYTLLGDDLVIQDESLNNKYLELLGIYGISYSKEKSHINNNGVLEFAKRFIVRGKEVTPFPLNALYVNKRKPLLTLNTIFEEGRKGWFQKMEPLSVFSEWVKIIPVSSSFKKKSMERSLPIIQFNLAIQGKITSAQALRPMLESNPTLSYITKLDDFGVKAENILKRVVMLMFLDSYDNKGGKVLGQTAIDLVTFITGLEEPEETKQQLIDSLPVLGVQGLIEELYLKLYKELYDIDTLLKGDWKFTLKALALPVSDEIFHLPNKELLMYASFKMAKVFDSTIKELEAYPNLL